MAETDTEPVAEEPIAYIPMDRCQAIAQGRELADRTSGAALFADISGFTPLTEKLVRELGSRRGPEELTKVLNLVYAALVDLVHRYRGSVIGFSGDAITCWFDGDDGLRAMTAALAMQQVMEGLADLRVGPESARGGLAIRVTVAAGPARRFLVGDPQIQLIDVVAGAPLEGAAAGQYYALNGEVVVGAEIVARLGGRLLIHELRFQGETEPTVSLDHFAAIAGLDCPAREDPWPALRFGGAGAVTCAGGQLDEEQVRPWLLAPVRDRLRLEEGHFMAELRPAVALFVHFGGLDYDRDDAAGQKLDRYIRWVQAVLAHYEGCLLQLTCGDKGSYWYAAFGAPLAHDDDSIRAVSAAIEVLAPPPEVRFVADLRAGISRGQMRVGAYGSPQRRTYGVLGDEVNVAARLMMAAAPGQILVSQRIVEAAAQWHCFQVLGAVRLKGKEDSQIVYAVPAGQPPWPQRPAPLARRPLVGREDELALMEQLLERVLAGVGQILRLQGEAGIGKSHLAAEFVERATSRGLRALVGTCQSTNRGIAYAFWRQAFRALFELPDEAGRQIAQLQDAVARINPAWLARLPLLGDLLALPIPDNELTAAFAPRLRQESLLALAVEVVQFWAARQPLLLLGEDAQWMDEASLGLTAALCRSASRLPVLLALLHRPVSPDDRPLLPSLDRLHHCQRIELGELSSAAIAALVTNWLSGEPSALLLSLVEVLGQGNPFFTEELLNTLRESGGLSPVGTDGEGWTLSDTLFDRLRKANCLTTRNGEWVVAAGVCLSADCLGFPEKVQGSILARMDRLEELPRLALKLASTIGRTFEFELLAGAYPGHVEQDVLLGQMDVLQVHRFARMEEPPPRLTYAFQHNIIQEVIYQTLLQEQQRQLHRAVGGALERILPAEVERLAYHYSHSDDRDKAILYLDQAAHKAQREYANETALHYYNQVLALGERWEWLQGKAKVLHILGWRDDEEAVLRVLEGSPGAPPFEVACLWGQYNESIGAYPQARDMVERALAVCRKADDLSGEARCLGQLGLIARRQGEYDRAGEWYRQALELLSESAGALDEKAQVLNGLGIVYRQQGSFDEARACYEQALALSRAANNRASEAGALDNLGTVAYHQRDLARAQDYHRRALAERRAIGDRVGEGVSLFNLAVVTRDMGDYGQAQVYFSETLAIHQATGNRWEEVNAWNGLGVQHFLLGEMAQARTCLEQALELSREIGDEGGATYILANLALVERDQGNLPAAEQLLIRGLSLARQQNDRYSESFYLSYLGNLDLLVGRLTQAIERAGAALRARRELAMPLWATADLTTLARAYMAAGDPATALDYTSQALAILDRCAGRGPEFPHHDYLACYQVLSAAGEGPAARKALQSAYDLLMAQAKQISDLGLRRSFLEQVPLNRGIVREYGDKES